MSPGAGGSSHVLPPGGLPVWAAPDPTAAPVDHADAGLEVELIERREDGWTRVSFSNGWTGWLDGRRLIANPAAAKQRALGTGTVPGLSPGAADSFLSALAARRPERVPWVPVIGGAVVALAVSAPWLTQGGLATRSSATAGDIGLGFLFSGDPQAASGVRLGWVLAIFGLVAAALSVIPEAAVARLVLGAAIALAALVFAGQVMALASRVGGDFGDGLRLVGIGVYLALTGGAMLAAGGRR
jgi:hypothetical protein